MAMTGILTGLIPLLTKGAERLIAGKKEKEEKAFELEKLKIEADIMAEKETAQAAAEARKAEAEAAKAEAETERECLKAVTALNKGSGIK